MGQFRQTQDRNIITFLPLKMQILYRQLCWARKPIASFAVTFFVNPVPSLPSESTAHKKVVVIDFENKHVRVISAPLCSLCAGE